MRENLFAPDLAAALANPGHVKHADLPDALLHVLLAILHDVQGVADHHLVAHAALLVALGVDAHRRQHVSSTHRRLRLSSLAQFLELGNNLRCKLLVAEDPSRDGSKPLVAAARAQHKTYRTVVRHMPLVREKEARHAHGEDVRRVHA